MTTTSPWFLWRDGVSLIEHPDRPGAWGRLDPALAARRAANAVAPDRLEPLFAAFAELLLLDEGDAITRRAVELARDQIGLVSASLHLAAEGEGGPYTVFDDCLIVAHRRGAAAVAHGEWIACTPMASGERFIGMMLNDGGASHAPLDRAKQAQLAMLCSLLGTMLASLAATHGLRVHQLLMAAVAMLLRDPRVQRHEIARRLGIGPQRVTRMFESGLGVSLPDYRNRLRLDRFRFFVADGATSLPDAAVAAGFESYAQCQQVSRVFRWMACLKRLTP